MDSSQEIMSIFEKFIKATSTDQRQKDDDTVRFGEFGLIPQNINTQNMVIETQFRTLEDFAKGYNVLKTCLETNNIFTRKNDTGS